jgi:hypothetical protein
VNIDTELANWQREWRQQTEPLPDVRKKIRRQDRQTMLAIALACVCMVLSLVAVRRLHTAFFSGLASGLWFSCLMMSAYVWRVRRGTWKPAAQTTAAYIKLWHERAVARQRTARFAFRFLLVAILLYAGFAAWDWKEFSAKGVLVLAGTTAELFFLDYIARKKKQEVITTQKMLESSRESSEVTFEGRQA